MPTQPETRPYTPPDPTAGYVLAVGLPSTSARWIGVCTLRSPRVVVLAAPTEDDATTALFDHVATTHPATDLWTVEFLHPSTTPAHAEFLTRTGAW